MALRKLREDDGDMRPACAMCHCLGNSAVMLQLCAEAEEGAMRILEHSSGLFTVSVSLDI